MRKAKIVATLGPSSSSAKEIESLVKAGVDVFRLNFSHGTHDDHKLRYQTIRKVEDKVKKPLVIVVVAILFIAIVIYWLFALSARVYARRRCCN